MKALVVFACVLASGLIIGSSTAEAFGCLQYSNRAVKAEKYRKQCVQQGKSCHFGGPRWQENFDAHNNWCKQAGNNARKAEDRARQQSLYGCGCNKRI